MQFLQRYWTQIQIHIRQLSATQMAVVFLVVVLLVFVLGVLLQYAGAPSYVPVSRADPTQQVEVVSRLQAQGIAARTEGMQILVPAGRRSDAFAVLAQYDLLGDDPARIFDEMLERQSAWTSNAQNAQALLQAKQRFLAQVITRFDNIRAAHVVLDLPRDLGFAQTYRRPSASVTIFMQGDRHVDKNLVRSIANWVSGAIAELQPQDVRIVDGRGRTYAVPADDDLIPTETIELVRALERDYTQKIRTVLAYIPDVIVAVNVNVDPTRSEETQTFAYEQIEPLRREFSEERQLRNIRDAGEPGVRPNTGGDILGRGGDVITENVSTTENEFGDKNLTQRSFIRRTGHMPRQVHVTVNVPRSYFVNVWRQANSAPDRDPDAAALGPVVDAQLAQVRAQVQPLIASEDAGQVAVHMILDAAALAVAGVAAPGGAMQMFVGSSWARPVGLAALALASLAIMFGMVRKATRQPPMPSAEELAGVPPSLPVEDDLVGEAEATEATMDGVELDDDELKRRRIAEQISEMVRANPVEAATILGRWVNTEE
jgi:flagellar M-ring protein FliF